MATLCEGAVNPSLGATFAIHGKRSVFVLQGDANIVQAIQQAVLAECIHVELKNLATGRNHPLVLKIHV